MLNKDELMAATTSERVNHLSRQLLPEVPPQSESEGLSRQRVIKAAT